MHRLSMRGATVAQLILYPPRNMLAAIVWVLSALPCSLVLLHCLQLLVAGLQCLRQAPVDCVLLLM